MGRFRIWCRLADDWYYPFIKALDRDAVSNDPDLAETLIERLRITDRVEFDPLRVAPGRYSSVASLGTHSPEEMGESEHTKEINDALVFLRGVRGATLGEAAARWPDDGVFLPKDATASRGPVAESHDWSDGTPRFGPVSSDRQHPFHHILGNVAEYVLLDGAPEALFTDRDSDLADGFLMADLTNRIGVIGGSAPSPPSSAPSRVEPLDGVLSMSGFSDVGLRLAFTPRTGVPLPFRVGRTPGFAPFLRRVEFD
ncbi:MAG TPA: hypothetical protein ENK11_00890 [Phycisphaerales bacterium]|nr:hypothetical protein [Phycisphaerales bacterium]